VLHLALVTAARRSRPLLLTKLWLEMWFPTSTVCYGPRAAARKLWRNAALGPW